VPCQIERPRPPWQGRYGSHNIKRIEHAGVPLAWFFYGEGKLRVDHSRQIIRKRDNKKMRIGTVAMAV
jgi:hypothetical protein